MLIDREDVVLWRRKYLRHIKQYREEGHLIYYLDETWVHTTIKSARQAFNERFSAGLKNSCEKGQRLIIRITHIGSDKGFLDDSLLTFLSKKQIDYHAEMNSQVFEQ